MHAEDVMKYGHQTMMRTIDGLDEADAETGGVCGEWSVKDILAHIASLEVGLVEVLKTFLDGGPTPTIDALLETRRGFNDLEVARRKDNSFGEVVAEYSAAHEQAMALIERIPLEKRRESGAIPWYGEEYDLEDFIVYVNYANKREHCGQIDVFRDRLA